MERAPETCLENEQVGSPETLRRMLKPELKEAEAGRLSKNLQRLSRKREPAV